MKILELDKVYIEYTIKKESDIFEDDDLFIENEEFWTQRIIDEEYKKQNENGD